MRDDLPPLVSEARRWGRAQLEPLSELPELDRVDKDLTARHVDDLLCFAQDCSLSTLLARADERLKPEAWSTFQNCIKRRLEHEPMQYIVGSAAFRDLELQTGPGVLIPRPETEILVETALSLFDGSQERCRIIDVGTGTGAIILSLFSELREKFGADFCARSEFTATDISLDALSLARCNAEKYGLLKQISFLRGSLLAGLTPGSSEDGTLIISNPPYIEDGAVLPQSVASFEPATALRAGEQGLDVIKELISLALPWLSKGAVLLLEIGDEHQSAVESVAAQSGNLVCGFIKDLRGVARVALITQCESSTLLKAAAGLEGVVSVSGAKNAALPLIISTILTSEPCRLQNVPDLEDIAVTLRMLRMLGAKASFSGGVLDIETPSIADTVAPYSLVKALRASFWVLGPLLARVGEARVALPGGDAIGSRPVDLHLKGLAALGADIRFSQGAVVAHAPGKLKGAKINLEYPSVGATHHLLMTAALVPGETVLEGAAREPEVVALAELLSAMGAEIEGAGSSVVRIQGRSELGGAELRVIGDRIEAATYLIAGAMCAGNVTVDGISKDAMGATLDILSQMGASIEAGENSVAVCASDRLKAASFSTAPVPGLATDVQPLLMAAASIASGTSVITETVFDNRFGHVAEYRRLGADIELDGRTATVKGVDCLSGAPVEATDIRAAAGLVLMGLTAAGTTDLLEIHHLDRGYETLTDKFCSLGAVIRRTPIDEDRELVFGC